MRGLQKFGERVDIINGGVRKGGAEIFLDKEKKKLNFLVARTYLLVEKNRVELTSMKQEFANGYSIALANVHTITIYNH